MGSQDRPVDTGATAPLDVIEVASAVLVRNFELLRRRTGDRDLDRSEYLLLRTLDAAGPSDICSLAAALGLDPSTAGRQVTVLAGKDLVRRTPAESDRRRSVISPTEEGLERMRAERDRRRHDTAELLDGWSEADLRTLGEMFTRYNGAVAEKYLTAPTTATTSGAPAPASR
ncbi:MarR family transcriptional regulator [Pseudonocardia sediminis]|uniref:MarR family transcriptional regulator n=1 Tax=Pseudonocardia sediminis TaxID=1397368 RepID=A0A4Q7V2C4_PSEST|nr:MarR family transcriptional regulator [Pseudonocardia sediminis]RZT86729.1 MarR family transcriptional regulator [Pseudonocardia sediminis]